MAYRMISNREANKVAITSLANDPADLSKYRNEVVDRFNKNGGCFNRELRNAVRHFYEFVQSDKLGDCVFYVSPEIAGIATEYLQHRGVVATCSIKYIAGVNMQTAYIKLNQGI